VARKWVGREEQIKALARLLPVSPAAAAASHGALDAGEGAESPVLLVHGPSGTGKTGVLRDLLPALRLPHAYVRGPEHPTARSLYGAVAAAWMRFIEAQARALGAWLRARVWVWV
jgi:Cdc6-like AAA superfamily ATPase